MVSCLPAKNLVLGVSSFRSLRAPQVPENANTEVMAFAYRSNVSAGDCSGPDLRHLGNDRDNIVTNLTDEDHRRA